MRNLRRQVMYSIEEHFRGYVAALTPAQVDELMAIAREYVYSGQASRDVADPKAAVKHVIIDLLADPDAETPPSTEEILEALQATLERRPMPKPAPDIETRELVVDDPTLPPAPELDPAATSQPEPGTILDAEAHNKALESGAITEVPAPGPDDPALS